MAADCLDQTSHIALRPQARRVTVRPVPTTAALPMSHTVVRSYATPCAQSLRVRYPIPPPMTTSPPLAEPAASHAPATTPDLASHNVGHVDVSIIVMAYNEAATLTQVLAEIHAAMRLSSYSYEVVIIDDGSTDGTGRIADDLACAHRGVRVLHHPVNLGLGEVYWSGFRAASGELLTFLPADGQFSPAVVTRFASCAQGADLVLGYLPGMKRTPVARVLSAAERLLYRLMFGRLPRFQGVMMIRRTLLAGLGLQLHGRGWGVVMELIVRASRAGKLIVNEPTELRPRLSGRSKVNNLRNIRANLSQALALWLALRRTIPEPVLFSPDAACAPAQRT